MQATPSLQSWLDHLRSLAPVTGLAHVGAGTGQDAARYANWNIPSVVFIEADENCHDKLAAAISGHPGWSIHIALLSDKEQEKDFYLASNPNENGVLPPESLASLWRNLKTKEQCLLNASTLDSLLTKLHAESETINWLVIDCLPALPVLRGAGQRLGDCDVIIARVVLNQAQLHVAGASKAEIDVFLSEHGYRCIAVEEERQPAIGKALYVRDWKTSFANNVQRFQEAASIEARSSAQFQKKMDEQSKLATERQQQVAQLTQTCNEQTKLVAERQVQIEQLAKAKDEQAKLATERQQQVAQLTKTLEGQIPLAAERQVQLKQQVNELTRIQDSLSQTIKTEITNATKQLEAFFSIQSYFESGQVIGELHGWPISPDLGLYLIQQLEANPYDLVIEFGSGTSTQLIAKTLATIAQRQPTRLKPIQVAFEHLERYHQKSLAVLQQSGLTEAVALHHTPLKPYTSPDGEAYSYYDCEPALQALANAFKNNPAPVILVLVDGPPGTTGPNARYPALPLLLKHFPDTQIDLILDDYNRPTEKEVISKWLNDLDALHISFDRIEESLDKGACKLSLAARNKKI